MELFAEQAATYRDEVLPPTIRHRLAVEAGHPMSWYRWVGSAGEVIGLERFGASAPYQRIYEALGLTPDHVVARVQAMLGRGARNVPLTHQRAVARNARPEQEQSP
jgi:transketolase